MDAFDVVFRIVDSPLFIAAMVATMAGAVARSIVQALRTRRRIVAFMRTHGFRWSETGSTMWLARLIERWDMMALSGELDGLCVEVRRRGRSGRCITVTARRDLVSTRDAGRVSLGPWSRPEPPAPLRELTLNASGQQLQLWVGGGDFTPYILPAVAYARTLEEQPVDPATGGVP